MWIQGDGINAQLILTNDEEFKQATIQAYEAFQLERPIVIFSTDTQIILIFTKYIKSIEFGCSRDCCCMTESEDDSNEVSQKSSEAR